MNLSINIKDYLGEPIFYADPNLFLYQDDCLSILKKLPDNSIDMIFADPPYFLSNDGITCQSGKMVSVNKGAWDKGMPIDDIYLFNYNWLKECHRVLKPGRTIFVSGTMHNIHSVGFAMQKIGYKLLNDITWYKINPPPNLSCNYFVHSTETIIWARKGNSKHYFNYELMKQIGDPNPGKQMHSLWKMFPPMNGEKKFGKHPTQKPVKLLERIIMAGSRDNELILDPFCGSGTTGVACKLTNRKFIGIDINKEFLELSIKRILDIN
jgi:site-specific DNA-methyltransferase (adenine-specific)